MLKIDGTEHPYEKAIDGLNFDKLGHPNGSGSWGIKFTISDNFVDDMEIYIGLKFDVISVSTSRFIAIGFNMEHDHKDLIGAIRRRGDMNFEQGDATTYDMETASAEHIYELYLDIHKVEIDIVELAKTIYQKHADINVYATIARSMMLNTKSRRTSRAISAQMLRQYEGNMETFSKIFTINKETWLINGLILNDALVADEIKYTIWFTPHDLEDSSFHESGDVVYELGDEYVEGLDGGHVLGDVMTPLFVSDRRGFRNGYLDVTAENPMVNHGFSYGNTIMFDTYMWGDGGVSTQHRHRSIISIDASYYNNCPRRLSPLTIYPGTEITSVISAAQEDLIKTTMIETLVGIQGEKKGIVNNFIQVSFIDDILSVLGDAEKLEKSSIYTQQCRDYMSQTLVLPLSVYNVIYDLTNISTVDILDSVIIIYHPVLDKTIFLDVDMVDIVELNSNTLIFRVDELEYGYKIDGSHGEFYWAGITKPFRYNDDIWMNLKGTASAKGVTPQAPAMSPAWQVLAYETNSGVEVFEDLSWDGRYATIMAVRKNDFTDIIKKRVGTVSSGYILGIPGGNINVPRESIWM